MYLRKETMKMRELNRKLGREGVKVWSLAAVYTLCTHDEDTRH